MITLESVTQISVEEISKIKNLQLGIGGIEESVLLCSVQPRAYRLVEEIPINWEHLGGSGGTQLQLLIKEYTHVFALDSTEVGMTEVVENSIYTQSHPPIR